MKKFLLFVGGLIALFILLVNLGPMILLGVSIALLYITFKQFVKSETTAGKIGWIIAGLIVLAVALSNIYAVIGAVAAYGLYLIYKSWKKDKADKYSTETDDPFDNFERQWAEMNQY